MMNPFEDQLPGIVPSHAAASKRRGCRRGQQDCPTAIFDRAEFSFRRSTCLIDLADSGAKQDRIAIGNFGGLDYIIALAFSERTLFGQLFHAMLDSSAPYPAALPYRKSQAATGDRDAGFRVRP